MNFAICRMRVCCSGTRPRAIPSGSIVASAPSPSRRNSGSSGTRPRNLAVLAFRAQSKKPRRCLIYGASYSGGRGRNRTGVHGFAIRCMTTLPPGLKWTSNLIPISKTSSWKLLSNPRSDLFQGHVLPVDLFLRRGDGRHSIRTRTTVNPLIQKSYFPFAPLLRCGQAARRYCTMDHRVSTPAIISRA